MSIDSIELLLHPVRMRIVNAMYGGQILTTAELCARMPDVSQASMYRQVAILVEEGVVEVESEERTRGPAERRYRLREDRARITAEAAAAMSREDHRQAFTAAMGLLLAEFNRYLDQAQANPYKDRVSYAQFVLWLSPRDVDEAQRQLVAMITALAGQGPAPSRRAYLLSTIFHPTDRQGAEPPRRRSRAT